MHYKVLLIVGAGPGISLHTAERFGKEGFKIALIARRLTALKEYEKSLTNLGITVKGFPADVSSDTDLKAAIAAVIQAYGKIDVLLYNAAAGKTGKPTTLTTDELVHDFQVSVAGALLSVKETIPHMKNGTILLTGGGLALYPHADYASLSIGKAGLRSLAGSLHQELSSKGIYVGTLTINGFVKEGTYFSPDRIADTLFLMYEERSESEIIFEEPSLLKG